MQVQVEEMLADHIIEESYSSHVNPLTLVQRDGKRVRTCLDAREANKFMTPDRATVPPIRMLLQRFHGASYISTLDLSSTFLQIPLERTSRKWTGFQFQNKVYQFTRVPYGFRNSLSTFIRALQSVLGGWRKENKEASENLRNFTLREIVLYFIVLCFSVVYKIGKNFE